jgi:hypothetical protein
VGWYAVGMRLACGWRCRVGRLGAVESRGGPPGRPLAIVPRSRGSPRPGELASPFFAKPAQLSFAGSGNPPHSPPARASHCTQAGGYVRERESQAPAGGMSRHAPWHLSAAAFAGRCWSRFILRRPRVVPYGLPGYRRLRRAPPQHRRWPLALRRPAAAKASGKTPHGVREYPMCAEGWALWVLGGSPYLPQSHRGYLPVGDAFRAEPPGRASSWGA